VAKKRTAPKKRASSARAKYQDWITKDGLALLEGWSRNGLTKEDIAHNVGCSLSTLKEWEKKHSAISAALKRGREVADLIVEGELFKRAKGYEYEEITKEESQKDGVKVRVVRKHVPGDVTAQIFWLKNRKPDEWRNKPETKNDGSNEVRVVFDEDEEEEADGGGDSDPAAKPEAAPVPEE